MPHSTPDSLNTPQKTMTGHLPYDTPPLQSALTFYHSIINCLYPNNLKHVSKRSLIPHILSKGLHDKAGGITKRLDKCSTPHQQFQGNILLIFRRITNQS